VVEATAAWLCSIVEEVANRNVKGTIDSQTLPPWVGIGREAIKFDKPICKFGVVQLDAHLSVPVQSLDGVPTKRGFENKKILGGG
jgi:hypothetical protein